MKQAEHSGLSERRRAALRLDLEDRQAELITELYGLARIAVFDRGAPMIDAGDWRLDRAALESLAHHGGGSNPRLSDLAARLRQLYALNRALARLETSAFGHCMGCGEELAFDRLSEDPACTECACCAPTKAGATKPA